MEGGYIKSDKLEASAMNITRSRKLRDVESTIDGEEVYIQMGRRGIMISLINAGWFGIGNSDLGFVRRDGLEDWTDWTHRGQTTKTDYRCEKGHLCIFPPSPDSHSA